MVKPTTTFDAPHRLRDRKQVRLNFVYVDFWSVMKLSFLASVTLGVVTIISFFLLFVSLEGTGALALADGLVASMSENRFRIAEVVTLPSMMSFAVVISIVNLVVGSALGAVLAGIFNAAVRIIGGPSVGFVPNYTVEQPGTAFARARSGSS